MPHLVRRLLRLPLIAGFILAQGAFAESPAPPRMPPPAPSPMKKGPTITKSQPDPQTSKQQPKPPQQHRQESLRPGNLPGGATEEKKHESEKTIFGLLSQGSASPGQPMAYTITDEDGKSYELKGRETTLRRLVGKNIELVGEIDKKEGAGVLKVKSAREAKGRPEGGGKKTG